MDRTQWLLSLPEETRQTFIKVVHFFKDEMQRVEDLHGPSSAVYSLNAHMQKILAEQVKVTQTPISCKKGCSFCCHLHIDITEPEADFLAQFLDQEQINTLERQAQFEGLEKWMTQSAAERKCVFLKNGECSIYENRPFMCAKFLVTSPPEDCDTSDGKSKEQLALTNLELEAMQSALYMKYPSGTMPVLLLKASKKLGS